MADIFYELLSIREPQTTLKNKDTTAQSYREMLNQNITEKSPGIEFAHFNCTREMGIDHFGYLNSSIFLFYFYFVTNLPKKHYGVRTLTTESLTPPPPYEPLRF